MVSAERWIAAAISEKAMTAPQTDRQLSNSPEAQLVTQLKLRKASPSRASSTIQSPITSAQRTGGANAFGGCIGLEERVDERADRGRAADDDQQHDDHQAQHQRQQPELAVAADHEPEQIAQYRQTR